MVDHVKVSKNHKLIYQQEIEEPLSFRYIQTQSIIKELKKNRKSSKFEPLSETKHNLETPNIEGSIQFPNKSLGGGESPRKNSNALPAPPSQFKIAYKRQETMESDFSILGNFFI